MAKRQNAYLNSLLTNPKAVADNEPAGEAIPGMTGGTTAAGSPAPTPEEPAQRGRGMTLLGRESALARIASGEVKQVPQLLLDPARVRVWAGNARHQASLNATSCNDLIEAIIAEGGQKVPAIVRRVTDDPDIDFEVIAGTRRHWAISWLRSNSWPEMMFLAQVQNMDDEAAFRLADIENRARKDVSDFERARNYLEALDRHYGGRQVRMAERLRLSESWLSKMLKVAKLPDWAVAAFSSPADIQLRNCYPLAQKLDALMKSPGDGAVLKAMKAAAIKLTALQGQRQVKGQAPVLAADVVRELMDATSVAPEAESLFEADSAHGRKALSVLSCNRNGVTVRLHAGSGANASELASLLVSALAALEARGKGLGH